MSDGEIRVESGEQETISVHGWVDYTNSGEFRQVLAGALEKGSPVAVDLSRTEAMDSSALEGLVVALRKAKESDVEFILSSVSEKVQRMMQISGLAPVFGIPSLRSYNGGDSDFPNKSELRRQDWRITESVVLADFELLDTLRDLAFSAACETGMSDSLIADVRLAVTEALINAYHHGSPKPGESRIRLRCLACPRAFVAEVMDEGAGMSQGLLEELLSPKNERGLGIKLIHASMDEVEYLQTESGAQVRMLKWMG